MSKHAKSRALDAFLTVVFVAIVATIALVTPAHARTLFTCESPEHGVKAILTDEGEGCERFGSRIFRARYLQGGAEHLGCYAISGGIVRIAFDDGDQSMWRFDAYCRKSEEI